MPLLPVLLPTYLESWNLAAQRTGGEECRFCPPAFIAPKPLVTPLPPRDDWRNIDFPGEPVLCLDMGDHLIADSTPVMFISLLKSIWKFGSTNFVVVPGRGLPLADRVAFLPL